MSTFRAPQVTEKSTDEHGRLLSDNVYGTQAEDAARRDFTINALYFDPISEEIWDYVGGVTDVRARRLKLIGAPVTRFHEDPVRMLRAIRLAAKVGVAIDPKTAAPIPSLRVSSRTCRRRGCSTKCRSSCFPATPSDLAEPARARAFARAAAAARHHSRAAARSQVHRGGAGGNRCAGARGQGGSPAFLFATLLWHEVLQQWNAAKARGEKALPALHTAMERVLEAQAQRISIPRRFEATIKEIWSLQPRFEQRAGARPYRLLEHERFRAAYDFLELRGRSGEVPQPLVDWWTRFQDAGDAERETMLKPEEAPRKSRRSRGRGRKRGEDPSGAPPPSDHPGDGAV